MKAIVHSLRERLWWLSLPLCFAGLLLFDAGLRFIYSFAGSAGFLNWRAFAFSGAFCLALTALAALLPPVARRVLLGVYAGFFAFLTVLHGVMYNIFGKFFTFSDVNFAGDGARFFSWSYFHLRKAYVGCIALGVLCLAMAAVLTRRPRQGKRRWPQRVAAAGVAALSLAGVGLLHTSMLPHDDTMWWGNTFDPNSQEQAYKDFTDSNRMLLACGLYQYTVRDFLVSFGLEGSPVDLDELDQYYAERETQVGGENEMTGVYAGKNFIMVMLESMDTWLVTPQYTPNLYRLQQEGIQLENHYTPLFLSAGTFSTEFISQTGLLPSVTGLSSSVYSTNSFPLSLAHQFEKAGYTANSFHSASPAIYSRGSVHENLGFEAYHNSTALGMDDYMLDSQLLNGFDSIAPQGERYFSYVITYSGHGPYTDEMSNISDPHLEAAQQAVAQSGVTGSAANMKEYTLAVAHAMETDQFVGGLLQKLEEQGNLEDTVLLFYADHYGKYMTDKEFLAQVKGVSSDSPDLYRTPCFFYCQGGPSLRVGKFVSAVDLPPTIVNLFGLDTPVQYYMGEDVFSSGDGVVDFPNGAWYDGVTYSVPGDGDATPEEEAVSAAVKRREKASYDTLKGDYFAYRDIS